jgi:hypothetical protein
MGQGLLSRGFETSGEFLLVKTSRKDFLVGKIYL